jgi:hypothetical protein
MTIPKTIKGRAPIQTEYVVMKKGRPDTSRHIRATTPEQARMEYLRKGREEGAMQLMWSDITVQRNRRP